MVCHIMIALIVDDHPPGCLPNEVYEPSNYILVLPPNLMAQPSYGTIFPPRLQSQYPQCLWYYHSLLLVVRGRDTFEDLETFHSSGTTSGLMRDHASYGLVEDTGGSAEVEGT